MRTFEDVITEFQDYAWNGARVIFICFENRNTIMGLLWCWCS